MIKWPTIGLPAATEDGQIKQRARWRLIGAVGLAFVTFVVLPLLFDPAPKPLGNDVEIRVTMAPQSLPSPAPAAPAPPPEIVATAEPEAPLPAPAALTPVKPVEKPVVPVKPAPKSAPKPAPKPPVEKKTASGDSGYYLQLGVFGSEDNARTLANKVRAMGYAVKIEPMGEKHRVRVVGFGGGEKGRERAQAAKAALSQQAIPAALYGS